jgi:hypothetical protein
MFQDAAPETHLEVGAASTPPPLSPDLPTSALRQTSQTYTPFSLSPILGGTICCLLIHNAYAQSIARPAFPNLTILTDDWPRSSTPRCTTCAQHPVPQGPSWVIHGAQCPTRNIAMNRNRRHRYLPTKRRHHHAMLQRASVPTKSATMPSGRVSSGQGCLHRQMHGGEMDITRHHQCNP